MFPWIRRNRRPPSPCARLSRALSTTRASDPSPHVRRPSALPVGPGVRAGARCGEVSRVPSRAAFRHAVVSDPAEVSDALACIEHLLLPSGLGTPSALGLMTFRGSIPSPSRATAWSSRCLRLVDALAGTGSRLASPWLAGPSAAGISPARCGRLRLGAHPSVKTVSRVALSNLPGSVPPLPGRHGSASILGGQLFIDPWARGLSRRPPRPGPSGLPRRPPAVSGSRGPGAGARCCRTSATRPHPPGPTAGSRTRAGIPPRT